MSPLKIPPISNRAVDIRSLCSLRTGAQKQDQGLASLRIVNAIAGSEIDPQFPDAFGAEPAITEIASFKSIETAQDDIYRVHILQFVKPILKAVNAGYRNVVSDFHVIFAYKRKKFKLLNAVCGAFRRILAHEAHRFVDQRKVHVLETEVLANICGIHADMR
jgi:hypothetical protein